MLWVLSKTRPAPSVSYCLQSLLTPLPRLILGVALRLLSILWTSLLSACDRCSPPLLTVPRMRLETSSNFTSMAPCLVSAADHSKRVMPILGVLPLVATVVGGGRLPKPRGCAGRAGARPAGQLCEDGIHPRRILVGSSAGLCHCHNMIPPPSPISWAECSSGAVALSPPASLAPNASAHLLLKAAARHERRLEAVRCRAWFGAARVRRNAPWAPWPRSRAPTGRYAV